MRYITYKFSFLRYFDEKFTLNHFRGVATYVNRPC